MEDKSIHDKSEDLAAAIHQAGEEAGRKIRALLEALDLHPKEEHHLDPWPWPDGSQDAETRIAQLQEEIELLRDEVVAARARANRTRISLTKVWNAHLELLLIQRLEDGTPILQLVLDLNPTLRDRLKAALER